MASIYEISSEYQILANELAENGGECTPEQETALAINAAQLQTKAINYVRIIKNYEGDIESIKKEVDRLNAIKKANQNVIDRMKLAIETAMNLYQIDEIKSPIFKINFGRSQSVKITDVDKLPSDCVETETKPLKTVISAKLKAGEKIEGAELSENFNLQIK